MVTDKKYFFLSIFILGIPLFLFSQTVKVNSSNERLKGKNESGYSVNLPGTKDQVLSALNRFLKNTGKTKVEDALVIVTDPAINGRVFTGTIYATALTADAQSSNAWIGFRATDFSSERADSLKTELEKLTYDFGLIYHRDKIQTEIDESNQALQAVERQQQRLTTQNKEMNIRLEDNNRERVRLEKSLEANKLENAALQIRIQSTLKSVDSVSVSGEKIKSVIEMQKAKQRNVK